MKKDIWLLYSYAIVSGLISLTLPLGVQAIITYLMGAYLSSSLIVLIALVIGGTLFVGILQIFQLTIVEVLQQKLFTNSSFDYAFRIPSLKLQENGVYLFDELSNRFFDTVTLQKEVPKLLLDLSTASLQMIFGLILISFYHPFFAFFSLLLLIFLFLFFRFSGPSGLKSSMEESDHKYRLAYVIQRSGREHWWNKAFGNFRHLVGRVDEVLNRYLESRKKHFRILKNQYAILVLFKTLIISILLIIGGNLVLGEKINLGQFIAAEIVIILIMGSVEKLLLSMESIYDVLTAVEKVSKIPSLAIDAPQSQITSEKFQKLTFREASLYYGDLPVLKQQNLEIHSNENVAFVVPRSSTRNVLLRALQGHIPEREGRILINGHESHLADKSWWRNEILFAEKADAAYATPLLERLHIALDKEDLRQEMEILNTLGITSEMEQWNQSLFLALQPAWIFNSNEFLWRIGIARTLIADPSIIVFNTGEMSSDVRLNWLNSCLKKHRTTGIWLGVASEDQVPPGFRVLRYENYQLVEGNKHA